jgi:hypothetical protein
MTNDFDAGCISRDDHDALLLVRIGVIRVTLSQNKVDLRPGVACTADIPEKRGGDVWAESLSNQTSAEPFMPVDNYFIPF